MSVLKSKVAKVILFSLVLVVLVGAVYLHNMFYGANHFADVEKKSIFVSKNETWEAVVDSLEAKGVLRNRKWFDDVVSLLNRGRQTHVGKFEFRSGVSNLELYNTLRLGKGIIPISVTLREGRRALSFARALHRTLGIDTVRFMNLIGDGTFAHTLGLEVHTLEGYLAPNTYSFNWQADEGEIIKRLVAQTQRLFSDSLLEKAKDLRMSVHEVLTLASIVEGEAFLDDERSIIAGVYYNRLRKGMKLQADPTIQFIIPDSPRRVLFGDLQIKSPYNTYMYYGLPPGPISNPGVSSIMAVLHPVKHDYLYFVANGKGGHWFSSSYAGHMNNVRRFRKERAEQSRNQDLG